VRRITPPALAEASSGRKRDAVPKLHDKAQQAIEELSATYDEVFEDVFFLKKLDPYDLHELEGAWSHLKKIMPEVIREYKQLL